MSPPSNISESKNHTLVFRFKGKKLQGLNIPWSVLKKVGASIIKLSQRIYSLDQNRASNKGFDYNFSMKTGSVQICVSAIENDETGFEILKKQSSIWESLGNKNTANRYLSDYKVRKEVSGFLIDGTSWADSIQFFPEGESGKSFEFDSSSVNILRNEDEQEAFSELIGYVYSINIENHQLGLQNYDGKKIMVTFNTVDAVNLRRYVKDYFYVKLINREHGKYPKVHSYKPLPIFDIDAIEVVESAIPLEKKRLKEISQLKDGWNGDGTKKVAQSVINKAEKYITYILAFSKEFGLKSQHPFIAPIATGKIQFEWEIDDKCLEIEFDDESFTILRMQGSESEELVVDSFMKTLDSIRWVLA